MSNNETLADILAEFRKFAPDSPEADAAFIVEAINERARLRKAFEDISEFAAAMTSEEDEANALEILDICAKALEGI